jgi:hypothetical protein
MKKLFSNQGQSLLEYIILTSLVGIFCLIATKEFGSTLETRMKQMKKKITENIEIR